MYDVATSFALPLVQYLKAHHRKYLPAHTYAAHHLQTLVTVDRYTLDAQTGSSTTW